MLLGIAVGVGCGETHDDRGVPHLEASSASDTAMLGHAKLALISDEFHNDGTPGFMFLPPMVRNPQVHGELDPDLDVAVVIVPLGPDDAYLTPIATFTRSWGTGGAKVTVDEENYQVNWHVRDFNLPTHITYRILVRVPGDDGQELGFADVKLGSNASQLRNVNTDEYVALVNNRTLPIKFRINVGVVDEDDDKCLDVVCVALDQCHDVGVCDPQTGLCSDPPKPDGASCDDGDACTLDDTCQAGVCVGHDPVVCAALDPCHDVGTCDPQTGLCSDPPKPDGAECDDGDACTLDDTCQAGVCVSGDPKVCDDGDECTLDYCDPATGSCYSEPDDESPACAPESDEWAQVSAGRTHTCGVKADGRLFCWGDGGNGRLGDGSTESSLVPVQEASLGRDWAQVSAGGFHTCAVKTDGRLFCWGAGGSGQLGSLSLGLVPAQESTLGQDWAQVSAGFGHTCAVKTDGRLFCWGVGANGRLGNNTTTHTNVPTQEFSLGQDWAQVSAGYSHTCAVKTDGRLFCWGAGSEGQLGDGSSVQRLVPVQEASGGSDWVQVSAGYSHTCAVKSDSRLFCWGFGDDGQLGVGAMFLMNAFTPVHVASQGDDWAQVAAGVDHTCAVKTDGRLFCWGRGGRLGTGSTAPSVFPVQVLSEGDDWAQVSAGTAFSCAVTSDGRLFCWGRGAEGQLGNGDTDDRLVPAEVFSRRDWAQVSAGRTHTCGVKADGRLFCWGDGGNGRLGNGSTESSLVPVQEASLGGDWAQVSAGSIHTCAVTTDGRLFCWGAGGSGELGDGSTADRLVPVQVASLGAEWAQVSAGRSLAGGSHTCAVKTDGRLFCWGAGGGGRLGNGSTANSLVPIQESSAAADWAQVSTGANHTCAVKTDGRLFCWGAGGSGALGTGSLSDSLVRVQESSGAADWAQVSTGANHTCAVKTDGRLFCWGSGNNGELGTGSTAQSLVPAQELSGGDDWARVSAGYVHTCAVKTDGRLFCWGAGYRGRLGTNTGENSLVPVQEFSGGADWSQVSTGLYHTCAAETGGKLFCWGANESGQLGNGSTDANLVPVQEVSEAHDWGHISAGVAHTCAVKTDGRLFCWGAGNFGQLGTGSAAHHIAPFQEVSAGADWAQVSAGAQHTCAVETNGNLFCWGTGLGGRLGHGSGLSSFVPVQESSQAVDWAQVSAGAAHTCAVKTDGRLFCWGTGNSGRLGDGSTSNSSVPVQESSQGVDWAQVSAGATHTCAVKTDGRLFCWGAGGDGRLGDGSTSNSSVPVQESSQGVDWAQVSAGAAHTCAVKTDGRLFCWGAGGSGRLGDGSTLSSAAPVQEFSQGEGWVQVSAGLSHTCAVKTDGRLFCWGDGGSGRLGDNTTSDSLVPVQEFWQGEDWALVTAGDQHTCAIETDGQTFCWGSNLAGQLGLGAPLWPVWPTD